LKDQEYEGHWHRSRWHWHRSCRTPR